MARNVFFSFHYQRDIFRVNIVRNHATIKGGYQEAGYWDYSLWEKTKKQGDQAIRAMINEGLKSTTVTVVLIGQETARRKWIEYEVLASHNRGNGIIGIFIHKLECASSKSTDSKGENPFDYIYVPKPTTFAYMATPKVALSTLYTTYDWVDDDGHNNFSTWVEKAAKRAGK
jgi:hypothetical protein